MPNDTFTRTPQSACQDAVLLAGGPTTVGRHLGISPQDVSKWRLVPERWCLELSRLSRWQVRVFEMRPEVFGATPERLLEALRAYAP